MSMNRVKMSVAGMDFTITTDEDPAYMSALGGDLNNKINRILVKEKQCRHRADEWYNGTAKTQGHGMTAGTDSGRSGRRMFSECRGKWSVGR